jgi:hypothetical protein
MKNLSKPIVLIAIIVIAMTTSRKLRAQPEGFVNFQVFYNELNPYGSWIDYPDYGYVWSPNVGHEFRPYATNGYWVATEYGNTWVSDYSWGWAPFHYGRWMFDNYYGWLWVPGNDWAPAWVAWRSGGGYYGWAPLSPNVNISVSFNHFIPNNYWVFVPQRNICGPGLSNYYLRHNHTVNIINHTTIINNVHHNHRYYTGPSIHEVERVRGRPVRMYAINSSNRPGRTIVDNRSVNIYRPKVEHGNSDYYRPEHFTRRDDRTNSNRTVRDSRDRFENNYSEKQNYDSKRNSDQQHRQREGRHENNQQVQTWKKSNEPVQPQHEDRTRERISDNRERNQVQNRNDQMQNERNDQMRNFEKRDQRNDVKQNHERNERSNAEHFETRERSRSKNDHQSALNSTHRQDQQRVSGNPTHSRSEHQRKR